MKKYISIDPIFQKKVYCRMLESISDDVFNRLLH